MLSPNMKIAHSFGFLGGICQDPLTFVAKRQVDGGGYLLSSDGALGGNLTVQLTVIRKRGHQVSHQPRLFTDNAEKQVLRLDVRTGKIASLVSSEKDHATRILGVSLEHKANLLLRYDPECRKEVAGRIQRVG